MMLCLFGGAFFMAGIQNCPQRCLEAVKAVFACQRWYIKRVGYLCVIWPVHGELNYSHRRVCVNDGEVVLERVQQSMAIARYEKFTGETTGEQKPFVLNAE